MSVRLTLLSFAASSMILSSGIASADEGAIGYRQKVMDAVGGTMQAMVAIAKQEVPHGAHLKVHAANMAGLASIAGDVFPAGSGGGDSDALPAIWTDAAGFQERLDAFQAAATQLDAVVSSGDMSKFGEALGGLGQSCKGCHDNFKAE
ncbi:MAG: cytochrome c [Gammaproteobacteria bacterium]|nr:cytochrome c [Gammaproteobacteria bacterium]